jgi:hypothetical protein
MHENHMRGNVQNACRGFADVIEYAKKIYSLICWVPSSRKSQGHPWNASLTVQAPLFRVRTHNLKVLSFPRFALDRRI